MASTGFIPSFNLNVLTSPRCLLLCLFSCLMIPSHPFAILVCSYVCVCQIHRPSTRPMQGSLTERWVALYHHALPPASTSDWPPTSFLLAFRAYIYYTSSHTRAVFSGLSRPDVALSPLFLHYHIDIHSFYTKKHIQGSLAGPTLSK